MAISAQDDTSTTGEERNIAIKSTSSGGLHVAVTDGSGNLATAASGLPVVDANWTPVEYAQATNLTAARNMWGAAGDVFGATEPAGSPTLALIQALTQNVRWRDDGTSPTSTVGMQLAAGDQFLYTGDLSTIEFIEESATAELNVTLFTQ